MIDLRLGNCLNIMPTFEAQSVDAIITDLPYGTTACKWDVVIPFEPMWIRIKRLLKPHGAFVTTASQPFMSLLVCSNLEWFKYCWYWYKNIPSGFQLATIQPMRAMEEIPVFYHGQCTYNRQPTQTRISDRNIRIGAPNGARAQPKKNDHRFGTKQRPYIFTEYIAPRNVLEIPCVPRATGTLHPTQKPIALYEYLIRTYTNEGDTVLDFCMGSGTTGVACVQLNRNFIGCELDPDYFEIAKRRIEKAQAQFALPMVAA